VILTFATVAIQQWNPAKGDSEGSALFCSCARSSRATGPEIGPTCATLAPISVERDPGYDPRL